MIEQITSTEIAVQFFNYFWFKFETELKEKFKTWTKNEASEIKTPDTSFKIKTSGYPVYVDTLPEDIQEKVIQLLQVHSTLKQNYEESVTKARTISLKFKEDYPDIIESILTVLFHFKREFPNEVITEFTNIDTSSLELLTSKISVELVNFKESIVYNQDFLDLIRQYYDTMAGIIFLQEI